MKQVLYHFHIPKTAGTSLRTVLQAQFPNESTFPYLVWPQYWQSEEAAKGLFARLARTKKYSFASGHFGYQMDGVFVPGALKHFTVLRNPQERALSFYTHLLANTETTFFVSDSKQNLIPYERPFLSLEETLAHPVFGSMFNNIQTRYLSVDYSAEKMKECYGEVADFGPDFSYEFVGIPLTQEHLEKAKQRLQSMAFGIQEHFWVSQWFLRSKLGLSFPIDTQTKLMKHGEYAGVSKQSKAAQELLASHNNYDQQLYDFALDLFLKNVQKECVRLQIESPKTIEDLSGSLQERLIELE